MTRRRELIETLLSEAGGLEDRLRDWQVAGSAPSPTEIRDGHRTYVDWFSRAKAAVPEEQRERFQDMFEGGQFISRIRGFLSDPLATNPFYDPSDPNSIVPEWQHPFDQDFRDNLVVQRGILVEALNAVADVSSVLDQLTDVFNRLPDYLAVLARAGNPNVFPPDIRHEADLQVVVRSILRLMFDDVRAEDAVPQAAGGSSRVDFLIQESGVVVETKMSRRGLKDRQLGEELLIDWGRYPSHPNCNAIFALIYDPSRLVENAAALTNDLSNPQATPVTRVIVVC